MNDKTNNYTIKSSGRERLFIAICDIAILIACCILFVCIYKGFTGWLIALLAIEVVSIIVIRHLGMTILNKFWLESYLNRALKKLTDLLLSSLVLLTAFPVIYLLTAVYTRCSKGFAHGSILRFKRMYTQAGSFSALLFNECGAITDQPLINRIPIFFNVLIGDLSLWDIMTLQEEVSEVSEEPQEQTCPITELSNEDTPETDFHLEDDTCDHTEITPTETDNNAQIQ